MLSQTDGISSQNSESNSDNHANDSDITQNKQSVSEIKRDTLKSDKSKSIFAEDNHWNLLRKKSNVPIKQSEESSDDDKNNSVTQNWETAKFLNSFTIADIKSQLDSDGFEFDDVQTKKPLLGN